MNKNKTQILFYVAVNSEYPVQLRLASLLIKNRYAPLFCFDSGAHNLKKEIANAKKRGFGVIELAGMNDNKCPDHFLTRTGLLKNEKKPNDYRYHFLNLGKIKKERERSIVFFQSIIKNHNTKLVIISSNSCAYGNVWLSSAAQQLGIKVCSLPFGMGTPDTNARKMYYSSENRLRRPLNFITAIMFPKWKHRFDGKSFLFTHYSEVWIQELLDAAPDVPWSNQGGNADCILVESPYMMDYYKAQGIKSKRMILTGTLYDDVVIRNHEKKERKYYNFCKANKLVSTKKMILVSLPPLMQSALGSPISEYKEQEDALLAFLEPLKIYAETYNIIVSIHPRLKKETIRKYLSREFTETNVPLEQLVGMASLFINCQSSTCRIALGAGVPCLDYDFYRFRFACFDRAKGYKRVENIVDYKKSLTLFLNEDELDKITAIAKNEANYYALSDGRNQKRILTVLEKLMKPIQRKEVIIM